jgi:DNA-binding response OmpR family regulator
VRGLEIEVFTRKVKVEGVPVKLTAREFDLLLFLAQNSEHVFTKNDLYNAIWKEENSESYYNAVAVYIKRLRNKIEEDPENPQYIETIWGVGYRFRD